MNITLRTPSGDHVHAADIPQFALAPEVIFWGDRVFRLAEVIANNHPTYVEVFAYALPDPNTYGDPLTGLPMDGPPAAPGEIIDAEVPPDAPYNPISVDEAITLGQAVYGTNPPDSTDAYREHELAAQAQAITEAEPAPEEPAQTPKQHGRRAGKHRSET